MTIMEAIGKADAMRPNLYDQDVKVGWLSRVDSYIKTGIIDMHRGGEQVEFTPYNADTDTQTVLLVPAPHDELYLRYLEAQIAYYNGENEEYNIAITLYNAALKAYENHYRKTHAPLHAGCRFIF